MTKRPPSFIAALLAFPLALLFAAASLGNIVLPGAYARETALWAAQGLGQDWVDLLLVVPVLVVSAVRSLRGSRTATLLLGGTVAYAGYSLVLYAFAVHFNTLFLVYSVGLGLSFYALVNLVAAFAHDDVRPWFSPRVPARTAGIFSALIGVMFYTLWLSELVPAIAAGAAPKSALDAGLITNPVQVLDVGIVLPALIAGGVALALRRPLGYWLVPVMLTFALVMDVALMGMAAAMAARKLPDGGAPLPVLVVMTAATAAVLWALLRQVVPASANAPGAAVG